MPIIWQCVQLFWAGSVHKRHRQPSGTFIKLSCWTPFYCFITLQGILHQMLHAHRNTTCSLFSSLTQFPSSNQIYWLSTSMCCYILRYLSIFVCSLILCCRPLPSVARSSLLAFIACSQITNISIKLYLLLHTIAYVAVCHFRLRTKCAYSGIGSFNFVWMRFSENAV